MQVNDENRLPAKPKDLGRTFRAFISLFMFLLLAAVLLAAGYSLYLLLTDAPRFFAYISNLTSNSKIFGSQYGPPLAGGVFLVTFFVAWLKGRKSGRPFLNFLKSLLVAGGLTYLVFFAVALFI